MFRRFLFVLFALILVTFLIALSCRIAAMLRETRTIAELLPEESALLETSLGTVSIQKFGTEGDPVALFLHGTGAWGGLWRETAVFVASKGFQAIAMDLPPFGFSDRPKNGDYSRKTQAKRVLAVVEALNSRPILVAHSFGASAGVEAVLQDQTKFEGLVVVSGALALDGHLNSTSSLMFPLEFAPLRKLLVSLSITNPWATQRLLKVMTHRKESATAGRAGILQTPLVLQGSTAAIAQWVPTLLVPPRNARSTRPKSYENLSLPTTLIWGDKDRITPIEKGKQLRSLIKNSRLDVMIDVGHIPHIEDAPTFQKLLENALNRISAGQ